ncbi:MAG: DUF3883 domain-containing protein [Candidatus Bathyarchaeia archaeon]
MELIKAIEYEERNGRVTEDVHDYCHYDLESRGNGETRYIEVKGHFGSQIRGELTDNEAIIAEKHADNYWLYIVCNVATQKAPSA